MIIFKACNFTYINNYEHLDLHTNNNNNNNNFTYINIHR